MTGWGIFVVTLAFVLGMIIGAAAFAVFAIRLALQKAARMSDRASAIDKARERLEGHQNNINERIEELRKMRTEAEHLEKRAPRSIPVRMRYKCTVCGKEGSTEFLNMTWCPKCGQAVTRTGHSTETPFVGDA